MALNPHAPLVETWWFPIEAEMNRKVGKGDSFEQISRLSRFYSRELIDALHRVRLGRNQVFHPDRGSLVGSSKPLDDPHKWEMDAQMVFAKLHSTEIKTFTESLQPSSKYWCICKKCHGSIDGAKVAIWKELGDAIWSKVELQVNEGWNPCLVDRHSYLTVTEPYEKTFTKETYLGFIEEKFTTECVSALKFTINLWRPL